MRRLVEINLRGSMTLGSVQSLTALQALTGALSSSHRDCICQDKKHAWSSINVDSCAALPCMHHQSAICALLRIVANRIPVSAVSCIALHCMAQVATARMHRQHWH